METSAQEIVLKIGNVINERYLAGKAFITSLESLTWLWFLHLLFLTFLETLYACNSVQNKDLQVLFKLSCAYEPKQ